MSVRCHSCGSTVETRLRTIQAGDQGTATDVVLVIHAAGWGPDPEAVCPGSSMRHVNDRPGGNVYVIPLMGAALTDLFARVRQLEHDLTDLAGEVLDERRRLRGAARVRTLIDEAVTWARERR